MANHLDPRELVTLEELALSNMWETSALVEVLERKGILTRQEVLDMFETLRRREPTAISPRQLCGEASTPPVDASQSTAQPAIHASC